MAERSNTLRMDHPVVITFLIIAVVTSMSLAAEVLKPLALAVLLSFALAPVSRFFERRGLPRGGAAALTVVLALGVFTFVGLVISSELWSLAERLPAYEGRILKKVEALMPKNETAADKLQRVLNDVGAKLDRPLIPKAQKDVVSVRILDEPTFRERLTGAVGPLLEPLAVGSMVLILVLFLLLKREDVSDRLVRLFGHHRISLTMRTMEDVGSRISRYLVMFTAVNSAYGLLVGIGLWLIGVPYPVLWGVLAALFRFIPYVGPAAAFLMPLLFAIAASSPGSWYEPLGVVILFGVIEIAATSYLEPVIYGKTTGVSALGLLVAAMFWAWLWGAMGLLLSTPLTVCLAVLGKYVPSLEIFGTLLSEEPALEPDVKLYQRLLAFDQDGAVELIDSAFKQHPRAMVYDTILIPVLARAKQDYAHGEIEDKDQAFLWRVIGDVLDDVQGTPQLALETLDSLEGGLNAEVLPGKIVGLASSDQNDRLVLRMLADVLGMLGNELEILPDTNATTLSSAEKAAGHEPDVVIVSHVPPTGSTAARYLVKKLRAGMPSTPIIAGFWHRQASEAPVAERLREAGATKVVFTVIEARERLNDLLRQRSPESVLDRKPAQVSV